MEYIDSLFSLRGEVLIVSNDGVTTKTLVDDKNLIVLNGRKKVAEHMLSGAGAYISNIAFGSNGTAIGDPNQIRQVLPTETTITAIPGLSSGSDYTFTVDSSSLLISDARPKLVYIVNIPKTSTALNGKSINELALLLNTNPATAFAIKRFATIVKSESISLSITWTIYF